MPMDSAWDTACAVGCPIRKFTDQNLLAVPRDLSQRATSFIASQCQGIHQMPFRRLILISGCATRRGKPTQPHTTSPQDAWTVEPTRHLAVLGRPEVRPRSLTLVFTLSMIPLRCPWGLRSARFRVAIPSYGSQEVHRRLDTRRLVEADGIEPTTSCLQSRRSPN